MKSRFLLNDLVIPAGVHHDDSIPAETPAQKALEAYMFALPDHLFGTREEFLALHTPAAKEGKVL